MAYSALRLPVEIDLVEEVGVTAHVDAVPQRGVVPHGAAPGAARLAGAHQYLDVVELVEMRGTAEIASSGRSTAAAAEGGGGHASRCLWSRSGLGLGISLSSEESSARRARHG